MFVLYKCIFLIQKHETKTTGLAFWRLERINGISININGKITLRYEQIDVEARSQKKLNWYLLVPL